MGAGLIPIVTKVGGGILTSQLSKSKGGQAGGFGNVFSGLLSAFTGVDPSGGLAPQIVGAVTSAASAGATLLETRGAVKEQNRITEINTLIEEVSGLRQEVAEREAGTVKEGILEARAAATGLTLGGTILENIESEVRATSSKAGRITSNTLLNISAAELSGKRRQTEIEKLGLSASLNALLS